MAALKVKVKKGKRRREEKKVKGQYEGLAWLSGEDLVQYMYCIVLLQLKWAESVHF